MKLIHEYTTKVIILIFCSIFFLEIGIMSYSTYTSKKIFEQIYNETLLKAKTKSIEFTNSINTFTSNLLMKYTKPNFEE